MRYATNIENEGNCPDCNAYESKIDRMNAKIASLELQLQDKDREIERLTSELNKWKNGPHLSPEGSQAYIRTVNERQDKIYELRQALRGYDKILTSVVCPDLTSDERIFIDKCRKLIE